MAAMMTSGMRECQYAAIDRIKSLIREHIRQCHESGTDRLYGWGHETPDGGLRVVVFESADQPQRERICYSVAEFQAWIAPMLSPVILGCVDLWEREGVVMVVHHAHYRDREQGRERIIGGEMIPVACVLGKGGLEGLSGAEEQAIMEAHATPEWPVWITNGDVQRLRPVVELCRCPCGGDDVWPGYTLCRCCLDITAANGEDMELWRTG